MSTLSPKQKYDRQQRGPCKIKVSMCKQDDEQEWDEITDWLRSHSENGNDVKQGIRNVYLKYGK